VIEDTDSALRVSRASTDREAVVPDQAIRTTSHLEEARDGDTATEDEVAELDGGGLAVVQVDVLTPDVAVGAVLEVHTGDLDECRTIRVDVLRGVVLHVPTQELVEHVASDGIATDLQVDPVSPVAVEGAMAERVDVRALDGSNSVRGVAVEPSSPVERHGAMVDHGDNRAVQPQSGAG